MSKVIGLVVVLSLVFVSYSYAQHEPMDHQQDEMMGDMVMNQEDTNSIAPESKAVEVGNKICPVSGNKIPAPGEKGDMGEAIKYEYNGKIYNLCCPMCIKDFKKNPEKYSKIAEDEVKASQQDAGAADVPQEQ